MLGDFAQPIGEAPRINVCSQPLRVQPDECLDCQVNVVNARIAGESPQDLIRTDYVRGAGHREAPRRKILVGVHGPKPAGGDGLRLDPHLSSAEVRSSRRWALRTSQACSAETDTGSTVRAVASVLDPRLPSTSPSLPHDGLLSRLASKSLRALSQCLWAARIPTHYAIHAIHYSSCS
jgi:hypothetical protein